MESSPAKQQPVAGRSMATAERTYLRTELEQRRERLHEALHSPAADTSLSQLLTAVDTALSRMDQGTFGICETCHDTIEAERLLADPRYRSFAHQHHSYVARGEGEWSGKEPGFWGNFRGAPPEDEGDQQQCESACDQPGQQFAPVVLFFRGWENRSPALRDPLQLQCDVMRGLVAVVRILCQAVGNQLLEGRRREWLDP